MALKEELRVLFQEIGDGTIKMRELSV